MADISILAGLLLAFVAAKATLSGTLPSADHHDMCDPHSNNIISGAFISTCMR